jgi:hypothetical protein
VRARVRVRVLVRPRARLRARPRARVSLCSLFVDAVAMRKEGGRGPACVGAPRLCLFSPTLFLSAAAMFAVVESIAVCFLAFAIALFFCDFERSLTQVALFSGTEVRRPSSRSI